MTERELRLKATTEGMDKAAGDVEKIAGAESKLDSAQGKVKESSDEAAASQNDLIAALALISPELAEMTSRALRAVEAIGKFGKVSLTAEGLTKALTVATSKYKDTLLLLGAGGAAAGAVLFLISQWNRLNAEMEKALANQKRFNDEQRKDLDELASFDEKYRQGVIARRVDPNLSDEELARRRKRFQIELNLTHDSDAAFRRAFDLEQPTTGAERGVLNRSRREEREGRPGRIEHGGETTRDLEAIARRHNLTVEQVQEAIRRARSGEGFHGDERMQEAIKEIRDMLREQHPGLSPRRNDRFDDPLYQVPGAGNKANAGLNQAADALRAAAQDLQRSTDRSAREASRQRSEPNAVAGTT